ncbi:MAG: hypothetical protein ACI85V_003003 [bacterium]|jgi:hypothetical protein
MFPPSAAPILFGLILSGMMTSFVTCIATWRAISFGDGFVALWVGSWLTGWLVAFPMVLILAPLTRRLVAKLVGKPS